VPLDTATASTDVKTTDIDVEDDVGSQKRERPSQATQGHRRG
jgi:hypothetical protein